VKFLATVCMGAFLRSTGPLAAALMPLAWLEAVQLYTDIWLLLTVQRHAHIVIYQGPCRDFNGVWDDQWRLEGDQGR
jgi:hypothetical protein